MHRFGLLLIWVVTLLVLAFGASAALKALRGIPVWPWWTVLMENAVSVAISVLILAPALELLTKGYAEGFARIMTARGCRVCVWRSWSAACSAAIASFMPDGSGHGAAWVGIKEMDGQIASLVAQLRGMAAEANGDGKVGQPQSAPHHDEQLPTVAESSRQSN